MDDASLGAMGSVIGKLDMLLGEVPEDGAGDLFHRLRLRLGFKDGVALVHLLRMDLEEISTDLEDLSEVEDPPLTAKCWMKEVRELSYDIEDYIDSFVRPARTSNITTRPRSRSSSISKISHVEIARLPKKKPACRRASNKISGFIIRAHDAKKRYKRYELDWHNLRRRYQPVGPMLSTPYEESTDLVIDGQMSNLIGTLASDGDHQLKVVSIVGSGGIGKTTLVRVLYNKIRGQFQLQAFIQMNRKPDVKLVLRQLLTQFQRQQSHDYSEDLDLISKVRKHLQNKRYLIVVDDLWSPSEWNIINHAFPEGTQCSRIIVTTQMEDVALTCCSYYSGFVHEMRPQDSYSSRKLFFTKVFGSESESDCPDTFKEASNKIIEICAGLPLATIAMASFLSSYPVLLIEQWAYVSDSLSSNLRTSPTTEVVRQVLNLSYKNLTHYLKTCLLYLNLYPEGYAICKDDLVKQWAAEGFIDATEGRDMERVARSYFDELINRRFLQPACIKYNNAMVSCTVHDTVHDLIAYKSVEENFVMVVDSYRKNVELRDKVHRLSLQFDDTKHAKKPADIRSSQVRSLFFFGLFRCMPSIKEFKLLRVLNLQLSDHHGDDVFDLTGISELFHLRYLKVSSDVCIELPKHMQGLQYLETLDIEAEITAVPWDIIHLPCLLHLHLPFETNLMEWIGSMRFNSVQKLGKLTNLRDLRLTCSTTPPLNHQKQNMEALGSLLTGLGNLNRLTLVCGSFHTNAVVSNPSNVTISWDGFTSPLLQKFEWSTICCAFSRVPKWTREFGNLHVLNITVKELLRDGVEILKGLPALTTLSIYVLAEPVAMTIFDKAGFSVLKYFKYRCSAPWLKFEAGAMPNLWKLKLGFNDPRVDQHDNTHISIGHLPGLQEISVKMGGAGAEAESDLVLAAAVINHPSNPQINVQLVDWIFYGDKATEKKAHGRIEKHVLMKETRDEISNDDMGKQTEEEEQGIIDIVTRNDVLVKGIEYLYSLKGEDDNRQTGERKSRRIEHDDIMDKMEDENKQEIISNFTPSVPSPHLPVCPVRPQPGEPSPVDQKGISGFLAESSLSSHLQALNLKESNMAQISGLPGIGDVTERDSLQPPSIDALDLVQNAAQAAAPTSEAFQSFQSKQAAQYEDDKGGMSDERTLTLLSIKPPKSGQFDPLHSAATHIQNKFRGWKARKEFLLVRQRTVKIQAHVRGHQVRKDYKKIVRSVGFVEKFILRRRHKPSVVRGLCGYAGGSVEGSSGGTSISSIQDKPSRDDYGFLQQGQKCAGERLQKALARVRSVATYPEAREQYRSLLHSVSKLQESQVDPFPMEEMMLEESTEMDFTSELEELSDEDIPAPGYF